MQPVVDLINKYKIMKLLTLKTDTDEIEEKKKVLSNNLAELDKFTLEQYSTYR
jgi:hypothetical protein